MPTSVMSTLVLLVSYLTAYVLLPAADPNTIFSTTAYIVGVGILIAVAIEALDRAGNVVRVDFLMLIALYLLTLLEFLFPQPSFELVISSRAAATGTEAVLVGFAGLTLGRHFYRPTPDLMRTLPVMPTRAAFALYLLCAIFGYLNMLIAVDFNPITLIEQIAGPRFSQPWSRGRLGDWTVLLGEFALLIALLPPIAGMIFARWRDYSALQLIVVVAILLLTLFRAFAGGTRSSFLTTALTFAVGYFLFHRTMTLSRALLSAGVLGVVSVAATILMLEFRNVGLSNFSIEDNQFETLFIDNNIINISRLVELFPDPISFLGLEIPYHALTKPIPRALWPGKPEGLSTGIEEALGAEGLTLSATFVGEAFIGGGLFGVLICGLFLGFLGRWWDTFRVDLRNDFAVLLYLSGFVAFALAMRSVLQVVPATLPAIALWFYGRLFLESRQQQYGAQSAGADREDANAMQRSAETRQGLGPVGL